MGFSTGFVVIYNLRRKVIREPRLVAEYYVWHSTFFPDLLAALPLIAEVRFFDVHFFVQNFTVHLPWWLSTMSGTQAPSLTSPHCR